MDGCLQTPIISDYQFNSFIGLSFEIPYFMEGLNLMIAKSTKSVVFGKNRGFQQKPEDFTDFKNCRFWKTADLESRGFLCETKDQVCVER